MKKQLVLLVFCCVLISQLYGQGKLQADYYNGIQFERYVGSHYVTHLDFYWDETPPIEGLEPANCSVLYSGEIKSPRTGEVTFYARVDDGIRVYIDDKLIIDNWQLNDVGYSQGKFLMTANRTYKIKVKYFNAMKEAELRLLWQLPKDPNGNWFNKLKENSEPVIIPSKYFKPPVQYNGNRV